MNVLEGDRYKISSESEKGTEGAYYTLINSRSFIFNTLTPLLPPIWPPSTGYLTLRQDKTSTPAVIHLDWKLRTQTTASKEHVPPLSLDPTRATQRSLAGIRYLWGQLLPVTGTEH